MKLDKRRVLGALLVLALALGGYAGYERWGRRPPLPHGLIQANGRIEGDRVTVASKVSGRINRLLVREGDAVRTGQVLAMLDDAQVTARVDQASARFDEASAQLSKADAVVTEAGANLARATAITTQARAHTTETKEAVKALEAQIAATRTSLGVLQEEVTLAIDAATEGAAQARALAAKAEAQAAQAQRDAERYRWLSGKELVARQQAELADLNRTAVENEFRAARSGFRRAEKQLADARLGPKRVQAKAEELRALEAQQAQALARHREARAGVRHALAGEAQARAAFVQARAAVRQARARTQEASAVLAEVRSVRTDLTVVAPTRGVVTTRIASGGEVVTAGSPLLEIVDLDRLYLKVFVPEVEIGKIRLLLPAQVYTDAFPDQPFPATVRYIAARAEFTPKEVQTQDERVKLVYAVRLYLDANPDHRLTPGLPADAVIQWKLGTPWARPRW